MRRRPEPPPQGDIWVFVIRGQDGRLVADQSPLQLPSVSDHHEGAENITCTARCLGNLGLAGVVSVRLPKVAAPTDDTQVITSSNYNYPALMHHRCRRRHRNIGGRIKQPSKNLVASEHTAVIPFASAPRHYSEPNTESWGERRERRRGTGDSSPRSDGNEENSPPTVLMATHPTGGYPSKDTRKAPFGDPHHSAYAMSPSTAMRTDVVVNPHPGSIRCNADCRVPRWKSETQTQSVLGDYPGESTMPSPVPDFVEVLLDRGGKKCTFELRKSDWDDAHAQGMSEYSDIVIGLAWRRSVMTQQGQRVTLPTIRLVSREAIDLPKNSWPTSWEGLLEHVNTGGFFRSIPTLRGGMTPDMQALLDSTVFDDHLPWGAIDRDLALVRSGTPAPQTDTMCLAQALASCTMLQQWNSLETTLQTLRRDEPDGWVLTPARLAALSVVTSCRRAPGPGPPGQPPPWWTTGAYVEIRINHLSPEDFAPDPHLASNLRGQVLDGIVSRLLRLCPAISHHDRFCLQDIRDGLRLELNCKDPGLFSTTLVVPNGPWITELLEGTVSFGGQSFCTLVPTDLFIETEVLNVDQQAIRAIRKALSLNSDLFRTMLDESLGRTLRSTDGSVRSRETTVQYVLGNGGKRGKRTMVHVSPDSPESRMLVTMDGTNLLVTRRTQTVLPLPLGRGGGCPVTIRFTLPHCPQQALRSMMQVRDPPTMRLRLPRSVIEDPILLVGPLPKSCLPEQVVNSGAKLAELRRRIHDVCLVRIGTSEVRLVGKYDKGRSPIFLYLEFPSVVAAQRFASAADHDAIPPEVQFILFSRLAGRFACIYTCKVTAEVFAGVDEKTIRALIHQAAAHPCPVAAGAGAAAGVPDNPDAAQH